LKTSQPPCKFKEKLLQKSMSQNNKGTGKKGNKGGGGGVHRTKK
jgi:hypothetical protein